jgi:acetate kinase
MIPDDPGPRPSTAILCLNVGSASLKVSGWIRDGDGLRRVFRGGRDAPNGTDRAELHAEDGTRLADVTADAPGPADGPTLWDGIVRALLPRARDLLGGDPTVAHRIVHGGGRDAPARIDAALLDALDALSPLAPLHQPMNLAPARLIAAEAPDLLQVAVFDSAFHATMPDLARRPPLPEDALKGLRRQGFHGLSYRSVAARLLRRPDPPARVVAAHLSGGASACAMLDGRSVDTTMGATPLDGLMMGTRAGAVDPGLLLHLMRRDGLDPAAMEDLLYRRSGLLGVSGTSGDMRALRPEAEPRHAEAIALYCRLAAKGIAGLIPSLGGIDALVFTGGAGAEQPGVRAAICEALGWLGLALDPEANAANAERVSTRDSAVELLALPTEEERMIAEDAARLA